MKACARAWDWSRVCSASRLACSTRQSPALIAICCSHALTWPMMARPGKPPPIGKPSRRCCPKTASRRCARMIPARWRIQPRPEKPCSGRCAAASCLPLSKTCCRAGISCVMPARCCRPRQSPTPQGPHEGFPSTAADEIAARFAPAHTWSASRLEAYGACPHQFFISTALELEAKAPPELGLDAAQLGSMLHAILEHCYAAAHDPADPQSVLAALPETARQVFDQRAAGIRFPPFAAVGDRAEAAPAGPAKHNCRVGRPGCRGRLETVCL